MKFKFPLQLQQIGFQRFFEERYILCFLVALLSIVVFSAYIFYSTLRQGHNATEQNILESFDKTVIVRVNELLDAREEYFNQLRTSKSAIKNPF